MIAPVGAPLAAMVVAGLDRAAVHHEGTKDTKDTKNNHIVFLCGGGRLRVLRDLRAFVLKGRTISTTHGALSARTQSTAGTTAPRPLHARQP